MTKGPTTEVKDGRKEGMKEDMKDRLSLPWLALSEGPVLISCPHVPEQNIMVVAEVCGFVMDKKQKEEATGTGQRKAEIQKESHAFISLLPPKAQPCILHHQLMDDTVVL